MYCLRFAYPREGSGLERAGLLNRVMTRGEAGFLPGGGGEIRNGEVKGAGALGMVRERTQAPGKDPQIAPPGMPFWGACPLPKPRDYVWGGKSHLEKQFKEGRWNGMSPAVPLPLSFLPFLPSPPPRPLGKCTPQVQEKALQGEGRQVVNGGSTEGRGRGTTGRDPETQRRDFSRSRRAAGT